MRISVSMIVLDAGPLHFQGDRCAIQSPPGVTWAMDADARGISSISGEAIAGSPDIPFRSRPDLAEWQGGTMILQDLQFLDQRLGEEISSRGTDLA